MNYRMKFSMSLSAWVSMLLIGGIVFFRFVYPPVNILSWDVFGYYLYLPATFIYHDLRLEDLSWVKTLVDKYQSTGTLYQLYQVQDSFWVIKEGIGLAILNAPAFFISHLYCLLTGLPADGFSLPYQYGFAISGLAYALIGVCMLRKILMEYFDDTLTSILLILVVTGTNYFQMTAFEGFLTHNYLFTLYTFIIWNSLKWHREQKSRQAIVLGLSMGLAVAVRPSEMVCILIPLLWGIYNKETLIRKWQLIKKHWPHLLILVVAVFLGGLPQMAYWKYVTGHWIYYTYQNPGEGLDLWAPYTLQFLFSFRKGWLIYTPLVVFAIAGHYALLRKNRELFVSFVLYFVINLWIISSWTAWWYGGGSYSQRAMLPSYVLLSIPLGYFLEWVRSSGKPMKIAFSFILLLIVMLNIFQTWQWATGIIDRTRMTKEYYLAIFGKTTVTASDHKLLLIERPADASEILKSETEYTRRTAAVFDFENTQDDNFTFSSDTVSDGKHALRMDAKRPYSPAFEMPFSGLTKKDHAWIRASLKVFPTSPLEKNMASLVITFLHKGENYHYRATDISLDKFDMKPGTWNDMKMDYLTPEVRSKDDSVKVYFWLQGTKPVLIDNLTIEIFD